MICCKVLISFFFLLFFFFFFLNLYYIRDLVSNLHPSGWNLVTLSFSFVTYTHLRDLVMFVPSSVTYIRQGGILLLSLFSFVTYTHLRDLVMSVPSSVTYIRQGGILLLNLFFCDLHPFKGSCHFCGFVSNVHPSRRNLVT